MSDDTVYRQAAINALKKAYWDKNLQAAKDDPCVIDAMTDWAIRQIKALPSAQPETPPDIAEIEREYKKWVSMPHINKPLAKALYEVWKKHDREDVSRNE